MRLLVLVPFFASLCLPLNARADDDDEREYRGKRREGRSDRYHKREYKEEFWDGNCKVEREWEDGKYKEERECKGPPRPYRPQRAATRPPAPAVMLPAPAIGTAYPPWIVYEQGRVAYRSGQDPAPVTQPGAVYCPSENVGKVIGGIAGAVLGNQVGKGSGRALATVGGAAAGVLIGGNLGRQIDIGNQACFAKALEFAPVGQRIAWPDAAQPRYAVVPGSIERRGDQFCRHYDADVLVNGGWQQARGVACRGSDGVWVAAR